MFALPLLQYKAEVMAPLWQCFPGRTTKTKQTLHRSSHFRAMLKAQGRSGGRTGTKILLDAMSRDKVHLARFVLDVLESKSEGAETPLISSILVPDGQTRCQFVELLLQRGANVNWQDGHGRTALSYACEKGHLDAVKVLVRNNADPEVMDSWGNTALMYAAVAGHSPVVEFLVRAFKKLGLHVDRQNKVGISAVEVAKFLGHPGCICALTNASRRGREAQRGARPRPRLGRSDVKDTSERRVGRLVDKLELLQTCVRADDKVAQNRRRQLRPRVTHSQIPPTGSLEEFETENDGSSSPPQELLFSGALTPKAPPRTSDSSPNSKQPKRLSTSDGHLPPLGPQRCEAQKSVSCRNASRPGASAALGLLMTPIPAAKSEPDPGKSETSECGVRSLHDSCYQKRSSLQTSVLSPAPPQRALLPLRKPGAVSKDETAPLGAPVAAAAPSPAATFSGLVDKLLCRFSCPEFRKHVNASEEDPAPAPGRMLCSETFPQGRTHPRVGSKVSIDSISSVKCEFDFHFRMQNS